MFGLEGDPLMHHLRAEQAVEVARSGMLDVDASLGDKGGETVRRVLSRDQPDEVPLRIGERGLDRMKSEQGDAVLFAALSMAPCCVCLGVGPPGAGPRSVRP